MAEKELELYIDDRCIIPDEIMNMSKEDIKREIIRLEIEAAKEKERILKSVRKA